MQELTGNVKRLILGDALPPTDPPPPTYPMSTALNQILYGPPGTGKTYSVIRESARIVSGEASKQRYDDAVQHGRIRLATFHQSFSYEDFVEGIRPVMGESGTARFEIRDGVFKEIAIEALAACLEPSSSQSTKLSLAIPKRPGPGTQTGRVWELSDQLLERAAVVAAAIAEGINVNTTTTQYSRWRKARRLSVDSSAAELETQPVDASQQEVDLPTKESVLAYLALGPESNWQLRADKNYPPYVLIIDEINRGNISRIFGELITLIEDDKRHGESNALVVTLPSSREAFTVPTNLYLLGTMNTADKSLALLDVALRRRFEFNELAPDFSICEGLSDEMREVMEVMNHRLEIRKDRDHRIGHAFFIGVTDAAGFNRVFRRKVVPLLQEYFFNDIDGARYVLGEEDSNDGKGFLRPLDGHSRWQRNRWRWFTDEEPEMDCWARLAATLGVVDT